MNERIKELAKQSGVYFGESYSDFFGDCYPAFISTTKMDVEMFAKLIVAECIKAVEDTPFGYKDYRNQIEEDMRNACSESIKEYFEIE